MWFHVGTDDSCKLNWHWDVVSLNKTAFFSTYVTQCFRNVCTLYIVCLLLMVLDKLRYPPSKVKDLLTFFMGLALYTISNFRHMFWTHFGTWVCLRKMCALSFRYKIFFCFPIKFNCLESSNLYCIKAMQWLKIQWHRLPLIAICCAKHFFFGFCPEFFLSLLLSVTGNFPPGTMSCAAIGPPPDPALPLGFVFEPKQHR